VSDQASECLGDPDAATNTTLSKILIPLGHPVEEILKAADEEGYDAIVLGTHGKGFLRHTFPGSVAAV